MNKEFWDIKAKKYPRPFEERNKSCLEIIEKINKLGVYFENKKIIDIGCGTGNYGLIFAQKAKEVFCLDFSQGMINALCEELKSKNIKNVCFQISSFQEFDIEDKRKYFDISFASMTPAVRTEEDVAKMEELSKEYCVFIGWAGKRENYIADKILSAHKIEHYYPKGFFDVREILKRRNKNFKEEVFETSWDWIGTIDEAIENFEARIKLDGKEINKKLTRDILEKEFPDGQVKMTTYATEGILIWQP